MRLVIIEYKGGSSQLLIYRDDEHEESEAHYGALIGAMIEGRFAVLPALGDSGSVTVIRTSEILSAHMGSVENEKRANDELARVWPDVLL
jgi:hypothetical protein